LAEFVPVVGVRSISEAWDGPVVPNNATTDKSSAPDEDANPWRCKIMFLSYFEYSSLLANPAAKTGHAEGHDEKPMIQRL
jgi:hypothetical protein